jgi:uncharacterized protein with GYD domain
VLGDARNVLPHLRWHFICQWFCAIANISAEGFRSVNYEVEREARKIRVEMDSVGWSVSDVMLR